MKNPPNLADGPAFVNETRAHGKRGRGRAGDRILAEPARTALRGRGPMRIVVVASVILASAACVPVRDNPLDPAIIPRARIQITVGGDPSAIGARRAQWLLDASESSDPDDSISSFAWSLSTGLTANPASDAGWIAFSEAEIVDADTDLSLVNELAKIVDFDPQEPGLQPIGTTQRTIRLVVRDHDGHRATAVAPIVVFNTAPSVDLGPDRRIAPGGQWWTVTTDTNSDGAINTLDATPHFVTVYANIEDADPGEEAGLGAENIRWRVSGLLAEQLDTNIDGFVDLGLFTDPLRRQLTFRAPLFPSRSRFVVEVSDTIDTSTSTPALVDPVSALVAVDVGSTRWIGDTGTSTVARLETSTFRTTGSPLATYPITRAAAGGRILSFRNNAGTGRIEILTQTLGSPCGACGLDLTRTVSASQVHAIGDGSGGWWVLDSQFGELHHVGADLSNPGTVSFSDFEGTAASDLINAEAIAAIPGMTEVWIAGGATPGEKLYRVSTAGLVSSIPLGVDYAQLAIDPRGGGWLFTLDESTTPNTAELVRFDDDGIFSLPEDVTSLLPAEAIRPESLSYDFRGERLWGSFGGSGKCIFRRDAEGVALGGFQARCGLPLIGSGDVVADPVDGTMQAASFDGFFNSISRFGESLEVVSTTPLGEGQGVQFGINIMEGGTVVVDLFDSALGLYYRRWIEAGITVGAPPSRFVAGLEARSMAVDPHSGALWVFDAATARMIEVLPDGSSTRSIDLGGAGVIDAFPAIDTETRRLWIAQNTLTGARLSVVDLTDDPFASLAPFTSVFTGPDVVYDVDVVPGGQVCVSGTLDVDTSPVALGWVFRESTAETIAVETIDANPVASVATADSRTRGCYFLPATDQIAHAGYLGPTGQTAITPSNELNAGGGETRKFVGGAKDYFTESNPTRLWVLNEQSQGGFPTRIFTIYDFATNTTFTLGGPSFTFAEPGPFDEAVSLDFDPYYRHFYVGIGDPLFSAIVPGRVLRVDAGPTFREIDRYEGFVGAVVAGTP